MSQPQQIFNHKAGVPATNSVEPVKMKLWLQISGKLGQGCTVNSNKNPKLYKLNNVLTSKMVKNSTLVGTDLVPGC